MPQAPTFARLSDSELVTEVARLVECERAVTADLIAALAAFDERRLYVAEGFSSLFAYCVGRLRLSEGAAYLRIEAARAAEKFPLVLDRLRSGAVTLTTVKLLAPHLSDANLEEVLDAAAGKTKLEVEELVARLAPRPDVRASVRKLPERKEVGGGSLWCGSSDRSSCGPEGPHYTASGHANGPHREGVGRPGDAPGFEPTQVQPPARPAVVRPLSPARYQLQVTMSAETHTKFRRLQELLRREIPNGDAAAIVDRALSELLEKVERQKLAATNGRRRRAGASQDEGNGPGRSRPSRRPRAIPAAVKREAWTRDGAQCTYVSPTGQRCGSRTFLELHHEVPFADGGPATAANIRVMCVAGREETRKSGHLVDGRWGPPATR